MPDMKMPDREKYIDIFKQIVKAKKKYYRNDDVPIRISYQSIVDILYLLKEQEKPNGKCVNECECWDSAYERGKQDAMKEQESKNVVNMTLSKDCFLIASCPKCNALLTRVEHKNYCGYCGQAVKWE